MFVVSWEKNNALFVMLRVQTKYTVTNVLVIMTIVIVHVLMKYVVLCKHVYFMTRNNCHYVMSS